MSGEGDNKFQVIARNTLMLYVRMMLVMGVTLYTSRIVLEELGVEDFGIYNVVGGIVIMFSFMKGAMSYSTQRYLSFELPRGNISATSEIFKASMTIHFLMAGAVMVIAEAIGPILIQRVMTIPSDKISEAQWVYQSAVGSMVISILIGPLLAAVLAREKISVFTWLGLVDVIAKLGVAFTIGCFASGRLKYYSLMVLGIYASQFIAYWIYCRLKLPECHFGFNFDRKILVPFGKFTSWSTLGNLTTTFTVQGCDVIINIFFGSVVNAAYAIATKVNVGVNTFVQNLAQATNPPIIKTYSKGDYNDMERLINFGSKFSFFLLLLLAFPILLATDRILHIWLTEVPAYTTLFTQLILVNSLLESFIHSLYTGIVATGRIKRYHIATGLLLILNLPLSYYALYLGYSPVAVFVISIILTVLTNAVRIFMLKIELPQFSILRFLRDVGIPSLTVAVIAVALYIFKNICYPDLNWIVTVGAGFALILAAELLLGMNPAERRHILKFAGSLIAIKTSE
ncbi:MAG: lipopolysaccharide biosynthesis protein [Muribaculaceae bacterium]|nr:lipopolysaccharide biosynthesis protein [Muribaculaceae bacterium]